MLQFAGTIQPQVLPCNLQPSTQIGFIVYSDSIFLPKQSRDPNHIGFGIPPYFASWIDFDLVHLQRGFVNAVHEGMFISMTVFGFVSGYITKPVLDNDRIFPRTDSDSYRTASFPPHHWSDQLWLGTVKSPGLTFHKPEFTHEKMSCGVYTAIPSLPVP